MCFYKMINIFLISITVILLYTSIIYAHPGRTDSKGGHRVTSGGYHYHHGYPAHTHPNGICPFISSTKKSSPPYDFGGNSGYSIVDIIILAGAAVIFICIIINPTFKKKKK